MCCVSCIVCVCVRACACVCVLCKYVLYVCVLCVCVCVCARVFCVRVRCYVLCLCLVYVCAMFVMYASVLCAVSDLQAGQGGGGAVHGELGGGVRAGQHELRLVQVQARLHGQPGGPRGPRGDGAVQAGRHQQLGHGHAQHARLLLAQRLWLQRARVQTWEGKGEGRRSHRTTHHL